MGEVYRARDERLGRDVAIKVLPDESSTDRERLRRFEREARAAGSLNHPNVLIVHDVGTEGSVFYVVSELLEGQTLGTRLRSGPVEPSEALGWAREAARGLAAAHAKGIVHRDLKPDNLFLTSDGRIKILDFGLAKLTGPATLDTEAVTESSPTRPGTLLGTLPYMAPEQLRGLPVDLRSDVFSFGVVLFEMVTGRHPFRRETLEATLAAILMETPPALASRNPSIPSAVDDLIRRCLEKRPEDRYPSARELGAALDAALSTGDTPASDSSASPQRTDRASPPNRVAVAVFENRTGDASLDSLGLMVADWITHGLGQIRGLSVALAPSAALGVGAAGDPEALAQRSDPRRLAEATRAGLVVSGSCYLLGTDLQIHARLSDPVRDQLLLAFEPVRGQKANAGELAERTCRAVVSAVAAHLSTEFDVATTPVPSFEAYQEFHQATERWYLDWDAVIEHLQRALALDPDFSRARNWLAGAYTFAGRHDKAEEQLAELQRTRHRLTPFEQLELRYSRAHVSGHTVEALSACREMEDLAPEVSWIRFNRAVYAYFANRPSEAVAAFLGLGGYWARQWSTFDCHAHACHALGRYEDQLHLARQGSELHPGFLYFLEHEAAALAALGCLEELGKAVGTASNTQAHSGTAGLVMLVGAMELRAHGQHRPSVDLARRAAEWYREQPAAGARLLTPNRGIEWYPHRSPAIGLRLREEHGAALCWAECWDEAERVVAGLANEVPGSIEYRGQLGAMVARRGDSDEARRADEALRDTGGSYLFGEHTFWRACIAAQLGERQKAVALLREAFSQGRCFSTHIHRHIDLEPLWDYGPFQELIAPARLKETTTEWAWREPRPMLWSFSTLNPSR